jgi:uncharacterized membrane-anchored protein YhcB (DUF1043 family)
MSSEGVVVGIVVGVTVGIAAARIGNKVVRQITETIHKEEIDEATKAAFQDGWAAASCNANNIRNRYTEMFEPEDQTKGRTTKS